MSTPAEASRRDRYLDAAARLFDQHGFAGTTTDMLVAEVGGSKATLYKWFPSKESLAVGLIDRAVEAVAADMADPAASSLPLEDELAAIGRSACAGVWSPGAIALLRLVLGTVAQMPELAQTVWDHGPAVTYARFAAFLAERERRGEVDVPDHQIAAEHFLGGLVGHQQLRLAFGVDQAPSAADTERRVQLAVDAFLARYDIRHR